MNWWWSVLLAGLVLGVGSTASADPVTRTGAGALDGGGQHILGEERGPPPPTSRKRPVGLRDLLPFAALGGGILVVALLVAFSMRRWSPSEAARYLEKTGAPWGRREELFVEKLTLELRLHHADDLIKTLALQERFEELDKVERPLRKMRARFRSVRREYRHIARRIGPVSDAVRTECAQTIRRCGLVQAPVLSLREREAMRRLDLAIERKTRAM